MRMRKVILILSTVLLLVAVAGAQPPMPMERQYGVILAGAGFPAPDSLAPRIDIVYRMERDFFVPVRAADSTGAGPYVRSGEILVELFDSADVSAAREIIQVKIPEAQAEPVPGERLASEGMVSFSVPAGRYRVLFEATDRQSQRRFLNPPLWVQTTAGARTPLQLYPVWFVSQESGELLRIDSFGRDMLFSAMRQLLVALVLPHDTLTGVRVDYQIAETEKDEKATTVVFADTLAWVPLIKGKEPVIAKSDGTPHYQLRERPGSRVAYLAIPLHTEMLPLRSYLLTAHVSAAEETATLTRPFKNMWPSMPQSLKNVEMALEALRFITTESKLDSLRKGDFENRRNNLERFWAEKDGTPGTALNEVMAEYYRRVDHAQREFATLKEPDGTKSDRGRIFVLYGPPTRTERSLQPRGSHTETWFYDRSKRQFTFVDENRNGTYTLLPAKP